MLWHHYPLFFHQYQIPYHSETRLKVQNIQYSFSLVLQSPPAPEARLLSPGPKVLLWSEKEGEACRGRELLWALIIRGVDEARGSCALTARGGRDCRDTVESHLMEKQLCTSSGPWKLPHPIPNTEGWPDDEGAWELRDQRTQDPGHLAPQGLCTWPVLFTCLLFLPSQKQFDLPVCDGLYHAQGGQPVQSCSIEQTLYHEQQSHSKISMQCISESTWSFSVFQKLLQSTSFP